jgi:holliday junction DNA helicase RuvA
MITKMTGTLSRVLDEEVRLLAGPFEYQVLVPEFVRRQLQLRTGHEVTLHTTEYLEGNQMSGRLIPRRIGFLSEMELEFFELFCTVDKIGARKALKAMGRPVKEVADAIQRQDTKWLTTLPGIGKTSAEQIIATLRSKVTRFALMPSPVAANGEVSTGDAGAAAMIEAQVFDDAYAALMALGLSPIDARSRLDQVITSGKPVKSAEDVLNLIFRHG